MSAPRYVPSDSTLAKWREQGLTLNEMVYRIEADTGHRVARSTVASALSRAGLTNRIRYDDDIPWPRVKLEHNRHYALTMLRYLARRNRGLPMNDNQEERLDSWLERLKEEKAVVTYRPDSPDGFYYIPWKKSDGDGVVRRPPKRRSSR